MQPEARCLLLVLFVCIVNLSNIVGVPPPASAGRRCLSKADAKVRTFSRTRKLFGDFFFFFWDFGAFFDLGQGHGEGIHIIYICVRERRTSPAAEMRGTGRKTMDGTGRREGGDGRETEPRSKTAGHSGYSCRFWQKHLERLAEALWVYIFFTIVVCILFLKVIIGRKCLWNG